MYFMVECLLLVMWHVTKGRIHEFFSLSRRVHRIRERKLREFAEEFCPREIYVGGPDGYWKAVQDYRRFQYILVIVLWTVVILAIVMASIMGCEPV